MTTLELEQVIREYIADIYKLEYIGKIFIEKLEPVGYSIKLGLDAPHKPSTIYAELEDELFLKFLKLEIKNRRFNLIDYGLLKLTECQRKN